MLTLKHINPDYRLAVTLCLTFAVEVLPILEATFSSEPNPERFLIRQVLIIAMQHLQGEASEESCRRAAAKVASNSFMVKAAEFKVYGAAQAIYSVGYVAANIVAASAYAGCIVSNVSKALQVDKEQSS